MASEYKLQPDFLIELIKCCLLPGNDSLKFLDIGKQHLKYHFLETEAQKKVVRYIFEVSEIQRVPPTIGAIGQAFANDKEVISLLSQVKKAQVPLEAHDGIIESFEVFIRKAMFVSVYEKVGNLYNEGKQQEAIELLAKEAQIINEFKLKQTYYTAIFRDFEKRQEKRVANRDTALLEKCVFGIHELDDLTRGGFNKGTSACILARSGAGKSMFLKWIGLCNARLGYRVIHFQAEGTEKEAEDTYDAAWTSVDLGNMELGHIPVDKRERVIKAHKNIMSSGGEIYVYAVEKFDSMSLNDAREIIIDIEKTFGKVDLVIFDYAELFTVKGAYFNSEQGERKRREDIANKITNIATEFKCGVVTATQANDIPPDKVNNPDFVITRHHISEFKGFIKPFSYFLTLNQTEDEYAEGICRILCDKFRKYRSGQIVRIQQHRENQRFYDAAETLKMFYNKIV